MSRAYVHVHVMAYFLYILYIFYIFFFTCRWVTCFLCQKLPTPLYWAWNLQHVAQWQIGNYTDLYALKVCHVSWFLGVRLEPKRGTPFRNLGGGGLLAACTCRKCLIVNDLTLLIMGKRYSKQSLPVPPWAQILDSSGKSPPVLFSINVHSEAF